MRDACKPFWNVSEDFCDMTRHGTGGLTGLHYFSFSFLLLGNRLCASCMSVLVRVDGPFVLLLIAWYILAKSWS